MPKIQIATRESQLALWQANEVSRLLRENHSQLTVSLVGMTTEGDRFLNASLASEGGKGLFVKELETSLLANKTDIAVHSMKDVPYQLPEHLGIHAILQREDPRDAFVSNDYASLDQLPLGSVVCTSSARRECQLRAIRNDLNIVPLRGNVNTRLKKLDDGQYAAIILASAGLKRLGFGQRIREFLSIEQSLPAIGQGAIGIECRDQDQTTRDYLAKLHHPDTALCVNAERMISTALEASCHLPIAAHATIEQDQLNLRALIGDPESGTLIRAQQQSSIDNWQHSCQQVVNQLLANGGASLLARLR